MELFKIKPAEITEKLVEFLSNNLQNTGLSVFVVGLSGGLDSAVSATLAAKSVGADKVVANIMPYKTSSKENIEDAQEIAASLGIRNNLIDISPMADSYFSRNDDMDNIRKGNFMARLRMALLYDTAAKENGLVLGTSNKTEALLGYGTIHGDAAWDVDPLWDLYKTQIRDLAGFLGVPQKIIDKAPTADLWEGQTDEGELGFAYARIDRLLFLMVDLGYSSDKLESEGFKVNEIERAKQLIKRNQFKRSGPVSAQLFPQYIGCNFVAPADW